MKRRYLMTPGPSPVPTFVREALGSEIMHHRTEEFRKILEETSLGLKKVFCTANPVLTLSSSGTGAMEAAVSNLFKKGDTVITISGGKFGQRWGQIAKAYGLNLVELSIDWGTAPKILEVTKLIDNNKDVKAILTTLCETSTATVFDIKALGQLAKEKGLLLVVDAISGLGQDKLLSDEWGVDVVVSGSQKGFMLPPGLGFISLSPKAQEVLKTSDLPKFYFNLSKALKNYEKNDTPYTPAVSLIFGLKEAVDMINQEGVEKRCESFERLARATRKAAEAIGLKVYSQFPSASVTALVVPENIKSSEVVKILRKDYGLSIAGGQDDLKDKIIRIAHMGWINEQDLIMCFSLLEKVLKDLGHKFTIGASISKLEEIFYG